MESNDREFQIFVKPAGAFCNLNCSYCYYLDKKVKYSAEGNPVMSDETLEKYVIGHFEASTDPMVFFSWHGGEPLLAGIDFYRKAVDFQKKYKPSGATVLNGIQTNGTLIDWGWAYFLASEKFTVGISIDGPGDLHNHFRKGPDGSSSLSRALKGYELLQRSGITAEILCVVNSFNVKFPLIIYNFFKDMGVKYITFLPLVEQRSGNRSGVSRASVEAADFGRFLTAIFDEWVEKDIGNIKIQIFEEAARTAFHQEHTLCIFRKNCGGVPVVEMNGDFYSCDHFVDDKHLIGNLNNGSLAGFLDSGKQVEFGMAKSRTLPRYCIECSVRSMCNGECPKNRFIKTPDGEYGLNYLCEGYKTFFNHCRSFVDAIAEEWQKQKE